MQLLFLLAQTVTDFADAFQIGKIHYHHCIVRNFQFRKFLPVSSNYLLPAPFFSASGKSQCLLQILLKRQHICGKLRDPGISHAAYRGGDAEGIDRFLVVVRDADRNTAYTFLVLLIIHRISGFPHPADPIHEI